MKNKKGLIIGVSNERSIAWNICKNLKEKGADIAISYQDERFEKRVLPLAAENNISHLFKCNVTKEEDVRKMAEDIEKIWPDGIDFLVHSVAFANKEDLDGKFLNTSKDGFLLAMEVSVYSLILVIREMYSLLEKNKKASIVTMSYIGAERVIPNYNIMGIAKAALESTVRYLAYDLGDKNIRINAISAGPIKTLAAMGIKDFREILEIVEKKSPLKRNVDAKEVADTCSYLLSDLSSAITGETIFVDSGYHILGL